MQVQIGVDLADDVRLRQEDDDPIAASHRRRLPRRAQKGTDAGLAPFRLHETLGQQDEEPAAGCSCGAQILIVIRNPVLQAQLVRLAFQLQQSVLQQHVVLGAVDNEGIKGFALGRASRFQPLRLVPVAHPHSALAEEEEAELAATAAEAHAGR